MLCETSSFYPVRFWRRLPAFAALTMVSGLASLTAAPLVGLRRRRELRAHVAAGAVALVHPDFDPVTAIGSCLGVGYLASRAFPRPAQSLAGLTVFDPLPS